MSYLLSITGFKRTFKVYQIRNNPNFNDPFTVDAFLLKYYGNYSNKMHNQVMRGNYTYVSL